MRRIGHTERMQRADEALKLLRRRYGTRLLAVGIYGSTAREEDGPFSDLELTAIIRGKGIDRRHEGIVHGLKYTVDVTTMDVIRRELTRLDIGWPLVAGIYLVARPLYDPTGVYPRIRQLYRRMIRRDFRPAVRKEFVTDFYERFCKFFNAAERGDAAQIRYLAIYLFYWLSPLMGLVNRLYLGGATYQPERILAMPGTLRSYRQLGHAILAGDLCDTRKIVRTVRTLYTELVRYTRASRLLEGSRRIGLGPAPTYPSR
jgi:kanamycin nucleotidyltransferase